MAYTKTTWNNLSNPPINADNLNKIEQGIYDNSLGIDKINPSGTATTSTEIEEGQITDVIGLKSLKLKGQTSQGENPTPDSPQDVNNVSGYNVVGISNENLLKTKLPTTTQSGVTLTNNGDGTYTLNGTNSSSGTITFRINQSDGVASNLQDYEDGAYTLDLGVVIPNVQMCLTQNTTYTNFLVTGYGVRLKSGTLSNATNTFIYIAIRTGTTINNVTIRPMLVKGTYTTSTIPTFIAHQGNNFEINLGTIELCKISTYQDYIFKKDGKWYLHKEIGKIVIDETYNWTRETSSSWVCPRFYCTTLPDLGTTVNGTVFNNSLCNMAKVGSTSDYTQNENVFLLRRVNNTNRIDCMFDLESVDDLKSILANENMLVYYGLITPIEEEITYTPLIRQLDELYNSGLYDVTNISQNNSSEAFILDIEACKNNINGIVEYIRR